MMTASESLERSIASMRREVAVICDREGTVTWCDESATRLLGLAAGRPFHAAAVPGAESKVNEFIDAAMRDPIARWELAMLVDGSPATLVVDAQRNERGVAIVGNLLPNVYSAAMSQMHGVMAELADLHRETAAQKIELQQRHDEVLRVSRELRDSNRGVVALHAELEEKAESLQRVADSRDRVVANVSHEFRTPVNSILGLTQLLLSNADGPLNAEQEKQIGYIRKSAEALSTLANDLLDLSRLEAGRLVLRTSRFSVAELFGALRGMIKPLETNPDVALVFDEAPDMVLETDEAKLSQILRNLIVNAMKFTEQGEVRVHAETAANGALVVRVRDTGIGIAEEDQVRIFDEFVQLENAMQSRVKGSGLGLSLSRRLADILGGDLAVESHLGKGSTFTVTIPTVHPDVSEMNALVARSEQIDPQRAPVLVVEDDRQTLFLYEKYLQGSGFQVVPVRTVDDARRAMDRFRPAAVVLDVMLEGETSWRFLAQLKSDPVTRDIPTLIVTVTDREQKARALGADEFFVKPLDRQWFLNKLRALAVHSAVEKVLVIDDDEVSRYLIQKLLEGTTYQVLQASSGAEGLLIARRELPQVIVLDFVMPEMSAFEVLDELKKDPSTRRIPVIVNTSQQLLPEERERLQAETAAILSKQSLSREIAIARIREALLHAGVRPTGRSVS